jgi:hypothetical protein
MMSEKPVKRFVWQKDDGFFFSTGSGVHADEKTGYPGVFFETARILPGLILQNTRD